MKIHLIALASIIMGGSIFAQTHPNYAKAWLKTEREAAILQIEQDRAVAEEIGMKILRSEPYHNKEVGRGTTFIPVLLGSALYLLSDNKKIQYGALATGTVSSIALRQVFEAKGESRDSGVNTGEVAYIDGWKMVALALGSVAVKAAYNKLVPKNK